MLVYCCAELMFATRIRSAAEALGIPSRPARDLPALEQRLACVDDGKRHDPVSGVVVDLDLGGDALAMVRLARAHSPTLLVAAFGPHVATDALRQAREAGADFVLPRSQFVLNLPALLERLGDPRA